MKKPGSSSATATASKDFVPAPVAAPVVSPHECIALPQTADGVLRLTAPLVISSQYSKQRLCACPRRCTCGESPSLPDASTDCQSSPLTALPSRYLSLRELTITPHRHELPAFPAMIGIDPVFWGRRGDPCSNVGRCGDD